MIDIYLNKKIVGACDPPFVIVHDGCFYFNEGMFIESYDYANQICNNMGSHLAVVKSGDENRGVVDELLTPNG